jgi:protein SCO1/2
MGRALGAVLIFALIGLAASCSPPAPARRYPLTGQVLAVHPERQAITLKHDDIAGYMPAMTMSYAVARPDLLTGRVPGELISATLEVDASEGRLVEIRHIGAAPLPQNSNELAQSSGVIGPGDRVPEADFVDEDGRRRAFAEWRGTPTVVTFVYTRCPLPNFCPLMDQNFAALQRMMAEDTAFTGRVKLVSITFDPDHDTPAVLKAHAAHLHADPAVWTFLTGDRAVIDAFAATFSVSVIRDPASPGQITHSLSTAIVDATGRVRKIYPGSDWTPGQVLTELRATLGIR